MPATLDMREAYINMFDRMGFDYRVVVADSGQIGGNADLRNTWCLPTRARLKSHSCTCGYAADTEAAQATPHPVAYAADALTKLETPGVHTIEELAAFLGTTENACVKALSCKAADGTLWVLFVPGDYEVNEVEPSSTCSVSFTPLSDAEMKDAGLVKGSMGPVGLPEGVKIAADESLRSIERWLVGANVDGFHFAGAKQGEDFTVDAWERPVHGKGRRRLPEVRQAPFQSHAASKPVRFSSSARSTPRPWALRSWTKTASRSRSSWAAMAWACRARMAAAVEQSHDENGIVWPVGIAPAHVCVIPLSGKPDEVIEAAAKIADELACAGWEVVLDDRDERAGVKFADADLIGWPVQVVVGKRGLKEGSVEVKPRATGEKQSVVIDGVLEAVEAALNA